VAGPHADRPVSQEEQRLCTALGQRLARLAVKLAS
jgi:hypothetical protein